MPRDRRFSGMRRIVRVPDRRIEHDVDDEIAFHIESRIRALVDQGLSKEDARRIAEAEFGDVCASRRELAAVDRHRRRRERLEQWGDALAHDLRYAARSLRRSPAFSIAAAITLVVGMGAALAMFAVVNGVLLRPLPYPDPDRLVGAWHDFPVLSMKHEPQAAITFWTYQSQARTIDAIGIYKQGEANVADTHSAGAPRRVHVTAFSASIFAVLGVPPIRGREFSDSDDRPGAAPVVLISEGMWHAQFGDAPVIGRRLDVDGVAREIIGVMPRTFRFPSADVEIWMPFGFDRASPPASAYAYPSVARLKPGVTIADAERDFATVLPRVVELYPTFVPGITTRAMMAQVQPRPRLTSFHDDVTGGIAETLWVMAGAAALLLLVACVNVATLALVRFDSRQRELAVREVLGAGRGRVIRHYVCEAALLAGVAGAIGLGAAWVALRMLVANGPAAIPRLAEIGIDARTGLLALFLVTFAAFVASVVPTLRIARGDLALREPTRGGTAGTAQHRVRNALVAAQIASSLVVLAGSGLLLRSFQRLHAVRPGFNPSHLAAFWVSLPRARYGGDPNVGRFYADLVRRVAQLPGVTSVGVASRLPLVDRGMNENPLYPEGEPSYAAKLPPLVLFTTIGGDYLRAMGVPLLAGTTFEPMEQQREGDAIISRRTATLFWHDSTGAAAIGKRFRELPTAPWFRIVGVVDDMRDSTLAASPTPIVYFPEIIRQHQLSRPMARTMALVIRTSGDPTALAPAVGQAVRGLDPTLPVFDAQPMSNVIDASTARLAFTILILSGAAMITLVLGTVGLYGVLAYVVTLRRRELGIRIALGAAPLMVAATTTGQGLALAGVGVAAGLGLFALSARFVRSFLYGVAPWDPLTLTTAALLLLMMATIASWIPARRAARVDPAEALRAE